MSFRGRAVLALLSVVVLVTAGCQSSTGGQAVGVDVGTVSGLPLTNFASGPKSNAPNPGVTVQNDAHTNEDQLAEDAIADLNVYWKQALPSQFGVQFTPLKRYISYDSSNPSISTECGELDEENAFYCPPGDLIAWDRGQLLPLMTKAYGPISVVTVLAHEFGHAIQTRLAKAGKVQLDDSTPTIVLEQQADCFAGVFLRHVAENKAQHLQISTVAGLNQALGALYFVRDKPGQVAKNEGAHGSAFDRTQAFQEGFEDGPKKCASYTYDSIQKRSTQVPFQENAGPGQKDTGDVQINSNSIKLMNKSLATTFRGQNGPTIVENGGSCTGGGANTPPASYCQNANQVTIDDAQLAQIGAPIDRDSEFSGHPTAGEGDFSAFATIASRYAIGLQKNAKEPIDTPMAGLRTACLVGSWTTATRNAKGTPDDPQLHLSTGDVDEAILGLLQPKSLIAADVNGSAAPAGFLRIEAFRTGFNQGANACTSTYAESAGS